ncbi:hypothetical protein EV360DRAFT_80137 [Lentinula raphanica]|nr:hypothetical protein EV360DRAFT_80137 [Lentinula raphanica]
MYRQPNFSLISITSDELRWLDAADAILQESSTTSLLETSPTPSTNNGSHSTSSRSSTTINVSTFPRTKNNKRHHYQRSTKSSSAKVVNRLSGSFNRRHSRSNLNHIIMTASGSSSSSSPPTSTIEGSILDTSTSHPIKTSPRLNKRTASSSSTHSGSPVSEWIYRRPKSPSASSPTRPSAIKYARRTVSDSTASGNTPSPASTADSSRCVTPTSTTYKSVSVGSYFPDVSTSCLNASSSNLPAHLINCNKDSSNVNNGSGSSIGSVGSIGVLIPSTLGLNSSASSLTRHPSSSTKPKASSSTGAFWTSILHPRSGPNSTSESPSTTNSPPSSNSNSKIARLSLGRSKSKRQQPQPSSPLAVHTATAIPSIWSGADLDHGSSPKRRKARGSLKELGISRIPVSSRITGNKSPTSSTFQSPPIYNTPVKRRASHIRSGSFSSTTSSSTSSAAFSNSSSLSSSASSSPLTPLTPGSPTIGGFGTKPKKFQPKFEPHHRAIVEVVEDDDPSHMDVQRRKSPSPTKSILASRTPYPESYPDRTNPSFKFDSGIDLGLDASLQRKNQRKDSVSTTVSSNKSVKFVEKPTVHYASAIYESWDGTTGAGPFDYDSMGIDLSEMDMDENEDIKDDEDGCSNGAAGGSLNLRHPYAASDVIPAGDTTPPAPSAADEAKINIGSTRFVEDFHHHQHQTRPTINNARALRAQEREDTCVTPTPDRSRERTSSGSTGTGTLRSFVSLKRKGSTASSTTGSIVRRASSISSPESKTPNHRPTISGPFALGTMAPHLAAHPEASEHPGACLESVTEMGEKIHNIGLRNAGLRSAPSLESFKSMKSGKSMRSLKSLPESVKSSISLRAKGMRDWFKGRVTVNAM